MGQPVAGLGHAIVMVAVGAGVGLVSLRSTCAQVSLRSAALGLLLEKESTFVALNIPNLFSLISAVAGACVAFGVLV